MKIKKLFKYYVGETSEDRIGLGLGYLSILLILMLNIWDLI